MLTESQRHAHRVIEGVEVGVSMDVQLQHGAQPGQVVQARSISAAIEVVHQLPNLQQRQTRSPPAIDTN